ncbi:MAG: hypothetical protein RLZZ232_2584 [Planctomycetota bacterium]
MSAPAGLYRLEAEKYPVKHLTRINPRILNRFSVLAQRSVTAHFSTIPPHCALRSLQINRQEKTADEWRATAPQVCPFLLRPSTPLTEDAATY